MRRESVIRRVGRTWSRAAAVLLLSVAAACEREQRNFRLAAAADGTEATASGYDESAYAIAEGKRLFGWFNCSGCHGQGGGGMGPPLMDELWRYGSEPAAIFATIRDGRPNGMPAFGHRIPDQQLWWLTAYVRSMAGLVAQDRRPGRSDQIQAKAPEVMHEGGAPRTTGPPPNPFGAADTPTINRAGGGPP